jgi:hypothetical protein
MLSRRGISSSVFNPKLSLALDSNSKFKETLPKLKEMLPKLKEILPQIETQLGKLIEEKVLLTGNVDNEKLMQFESTKPTPEVLFEHINLFLLPDGVKQILEKYGVSNAVANVNGKTIHLNTINDVCDIFKALSDNKTGQKGGGFFVGQKVMYRDNAYVVVSLKAPNRPTYGITTLSDYKSGGDNMRIVYAADNELTSAESTSFVSISAGIVGKLLYIFIVFIFSYYTFLNFLYIPYYLNKSGSKTMLASTAAITEYNSLLDSLPLNPVEVVRKLNDTTMMMYKAYGSILALMASNAQSFVISGIVLTFNTVITGITDSVRIIFLDLPTDVKVEIFVDFAKKFMLGGIAFAVSGVTLSAENTDWWSGTLSKVIWGGLTLAVGGGAQDVLGTIGLMANTNNPAAAYKKRLEDEEANQKREDNAEKQRAYAERIRQQDIELEEREREREREERQRRLEQQDRQISQILEFARKPTLQDKDNSNSYNSNKGGSRMRKPMRKTRRKSRNNRRRRASRNKK